MSTERGTSAAEQEGWHPPANVERKAQRPSVESAPKMDAPPVFRVPEGTVETVVPGTVLVTKEGLLDAMVATNYDGVVFPEDDEPTLATERSILDHNEELPPSPRVQRIQSVLKRLRVPFALLAGALGIAGGHSAVEGYQNLEANKAAAESALHEARDSVGGGMAEFSRAHKPSDGETVRLSDGTETTRGEWTVAVNVANTQGNFLKIDLYGNSWGGNGTFLKDFGTEIPRSAMEDGLHAVQGEHANLSERLSPFFGDNLDSVADSMLRDKARGATNEQSLKQVIEKTYGASAPDVLAKLEASGTSLHDASESLVELLRADRAEGLFTQSLDGSGPAMGYDAATMTDAYGASLRMNDAMYVATAAIVGLTGAEQMKIHGQMMTTRADGGIFHVESTMAGDSVSIGGLANLEGGIDAKAVQKEMVSFGSNASSLVIEATNLANADPTTRATVIEKTQGFLGDQMKLVEAQSNVVAAEKAATGIAESVAAMRAAEDKVDLSLKILTAATGNNPEVSKMAAEITSGNAKAAEKIISSAKLVEGLSG